jgi:hypothetical protein
MKITAKKYDPPWRRRTGKLNPPIKPSDVYPNGLRPHGARQPLAEYSLMGKIISIINGYSGYS